MADVLPSDPQRALQVPSEKPLKPSLDDIYAELDAAGARDFKVERDLSTAVSRRQI